MLTLSQAYRQQLHTRPATKSSVPYDLMDALTPDEYSDYAVSQILLLNDYK